MKQTPVLHPLRAVDTKPLVRLDLDTKIFARAFDRMAAPRTPFKRSSTAYKDGWALVKIIGLDPHGPEHQTVSLIIKGIGKSGKRNQGHTEGRTQQLDGIGAQIQDRRAVRTTFIFPVAMLSSMAQFMKTDRADATLDLFENGAVLANHHCCYDLLCQEHNVPLPTLALLAPEIARDVVAAQEEAARLQREEAAERDRKQAVAQECHDLFIAELRKLWPVEWDATIELLALPKACKERISTALGVDCWDWKHDETVRASLGLIAPSRRPYAPGSQAEQRNRIARDVENDVNRWQTNTGRDLQSTANEGLWAIPPSIRHFVEYGNRPQQFESADRMRERWTPVTPMPVATALETARARSTRISAHAVEDYETMLERLQRRTGE